MPPCEGSRDNAAECDEERKREKRRINDRIRRSTAASQKTLRNRTEANAGNKQLEAVVVKRPVDRHALAACKRLSMVGLMAAMPEASAKLASVR
jgi:hypothetical protein